jgi:peptide/nickel transport system substrate-binding protein
VLSDRAGMMVSPQAAAREDFAAHPVCAGPYKFAERKARDLIRLEKFSGYWNGGKYGYDSVTYYYVPDSTVRLSRVRAGDLEIVERVAPTDLKTVREDRNLRLHGAPGLAVSHLMINMATGEKARGALGRDPRLRKALELALDRTVDPYHSAKFPMPKRDVAAAKALLAQAGMTTVPLEITFENSPTDARVAQIVQSMAKEAGFDIKLLPLETTSAIQRYLAGDFEAYIGNWSGRADPDPTLYAFFSCNGSQNVNKYCSKELDSVLDAARAETDMERRKALYDQATGIYLGDLPTIPM